jgi:large exoprotein involved in heme utilization and adhesion
LPDFRRKSNVSSAITSNVEKTGKGNSGGIDITTKNLSITNLGQVGANIFGEGNGGLVKINANNISIDGNNNPIKIYSGITSITTGKGNAGNIDITTKNLSITDAAQIGTGVYGEGNGGSVKINSDTISIDGRKDEVASSISSSVGLENTGNAGSVDINTKNLFITNGALVGADIKGEGKAGSVNINASDTIFVDGSKNGIASTISSAVEPTGKGTSGDVSITTKNLSLTNGGQISTSNVGIGEIGGNLNLSFTGVLSLRGGSSISARAIGDANGGNITIDAPNGFIVAFPNQNNDILATAEQGQGGNININARRVYGFDQNRIQQLSEDREVILKNGENDINSSSGNPQLSGNVNINTQPLDPAKERTTIPEDIVEPDRAVASACSPSGSGEIANSFTITGRGGSPTDPTKPLNSSYLSGEQGAGSREQGSRGAGEQGSRGAESRGNPLWLSRSRGEAIKLDENKKTFSSDEVIPARGMITNEKGQIVLTAYPTPNTTDRNFSQAIACNGGI